MSSATRRSQVTYGRRSRPKFNVFRDQEEFQNASAQGKSSLATPGKTPGKKGTSALPPSDMDEIDEELLDSDENVTTTRGGSTTFTVQNPKAGHGAIGATPRLASKTQGKKNNIIPAKLKEKTTNTRVVTRASMLQTPISNPPAEQKLDHRINHQKSTTASPSGVKLHTSPLAHKSKVKPTITSEPQLEDQDFLNILPPAKSRSSHRRFGFAHGSKAGDTKYTKPFHEPPRNSGIQAHISATRATNPGSRLIQKAKDVVNSTRANIFGNKPAVSSGGSHKSRGAEASQSWRKLRKGSTVYNNVQEDIESDNLNEKTTPHSQAQRYAQGLSRAGDSQQNLLEGSISESSSEAEEMEDLIQSDQTHQNRSDRMAIDTDFKEGPIATSTPRRKIDQKRKSKKTRKTLPDVEDYDLAFDGDVEMVTGDDEAASEEYGDAMSSGEPIGEALESVKYDFSVFGASDPFDDGFWSLPGIPASITTSMKGKDERSIRVSKDCMDIDITNTKKRSYEASTQEGSSKNTNTKRRPLETQPNPSDAQLQNKRGARATRLEKPPVDESVLSDDELGTHQYVLVGMKPGMDGGRSKMRPKTRKNNKGVEVKKRRNNSARGDVMDVDEKQWNDIQ
ncbi:hypothetical protein DFH27DRAFT_247652 [Peziza echinospora]|nr:hypothetical protein DFH27DRAFT_247652 [Peziza echinospora]